MRLKELYKKEILPKIKEELGIKNVLAVPRLLKVSINVGFGKHTKDKDYVDSVINNLTAISGQKPAQTKAKKAISAFKIRQGMIIGAKVTLRGDRMYDFVEKLVNIYFPRVRDFRGITDKTIDKTGNMSIGFKEVLAFPEVEEQSLENVHGLEVNIATSAKDKTEALALFRAMNFPFKKEENKK
ncbi:50S ribosomal protein L5 [Candidatus Falkowbacteria bacterium]|nr:50S ribosomal protein L5 [Candidatus Falkowbacteria bacterium]